MRCLTHLNPRTEALYSYIFHFCQVSLLHRTRLPEKITAQENAALDAYISFLLLGTESAEVQKNTGFWVYYNDML